LERGSQPHSHQLGSGECCKFPSGVRGGAPAAEEFSCITCCRIAYVLTFMSVVSHPPHLCMHLLCEISLFYSVIHLF